MPIDRDALMNDYAAVSIPESVRADLGASCFFARTTVERAADGRVDVPATFRNEGARASMLAFLDRIDKARKGKQAANEPAKAASSTAEEN